MAASQLQHVLIADDQEGAAELLSEILHLSVEARLTTDIGHDGAEAVRLAVSHRPDIVLLDIDMPIMNGVEAAFAIRDTFPTEQPLLIAITGNSCWLRNDRAQAIFDFILVKPLDIDSLVHLVNMKGTSIR